MPSNSVQPSSVSRGEADASGALSVFSPAFQKTMTLSGTKFPTNSSFPMDSPMSISVVAAWRMSAKAAWTGSESMDFSPQIARNSTAHTASCAKKWFG